MMKRTLLLILLSLSALSFASEVVFTTTETNKGKQEASTLGSTLTSTYNNESGLNSKVFNPMSSNEVEMSTVDGSQSGIVNVTCEADTNPFARLSYSGTSDITINVQLDLNHDGIFEKNTNFSGVSGIHTSGVIVCSSNSFSNCRYYNWGFDSTSKNLILIQTTQHETRSSYCINSSCGSLAATQKTKILEDISAGISAVLQQVSIDYMITRTYTTNSYIELFGQDQSNCSGSSKYSASLSGTPSHSELLNEADAAKTTDNVGFEVLTTADNNGQNLNKVESSELADVLTVSAVSSQATVDASDPTKINYTTKVQDESGNWVEQSSNTKIAFDAQVEPQSCMVKWEEIETQVTSDGNVKGHTTAGLKTTIKTEIRECTGANYTVCPVNSNESIKYDCGNLGNSMAETAAALSVLETMTKDLTCSQE